MSPRRIFGPASAALGLALAVALGTLPAAAQDVEMTSKVQGVPLPSAYFEAVRDIPGAFELARGWMARAELVRQAGLALEGELPMLVIQILFSDSPEPHVSVAEIERALFTGPAEHGTLTDYYLEVSGGRLEVKGEVLPWIRTGVTRAEAVGTSHGLAGDAELGRALRQALEAADTLIDFGRFDNDGPDGIPNSGDDDGFVDVVAFQFIEVAASCGGNGVWPHRWRISGRDEVFESRARRSDGQPILADDYIIQSAVVCSGDGVQTSATIAHELGHVLGLPDLYDAAEGILPEARRWIVGCWGLMAAGAWGCGDPSERGDAIMPTHMTPWSKERLGWMQPRSVEPGVDREVVLGPVREAGEALRVPLSPHSHLHVEYRTRDGFDRDLPGSGIMVYHIDESKPVRRPSGEAPLELRVMVLEGDGNDSLLRTAPEGGSRGQAGDAWAVDEPGILTNATYPSTRLHGGAPSAVTLRDLRIVEGAARFRISTEAIPAVRLLRALFGTGATTLTEAEEAYLDRVGNANGVFDIGDVRAYLRDQPTAR